MGNINSGNVLKLTGDQNATASNVVGTTLKLTPPKGYYDGVTGTVNITDADFVASKILNGTNLFGVNGTLVQVPNVVASATYRVSADNVKSTDNEIPTKVKEISVALTGTYRVYHEAVADVNSITWQIKKNGVYVNQGTKTGTAYTSYTNDVSCVAGDLLQLYIYANDSVAEGSIKNFRLGFDYPSPTSGTVIMN